MCRERRGQNVKIEKSISDRIERKVTLTTEADKTATLSPSHRQKWEASETEQTDSGQKVNFRQICNAFAIADRSGGQAWPSRQIRDRKSISERIVRKIAIQRELKMKAQKADRKGNNPKK